MASMNFRKTGSGAISISDSEGYLVSIQNGAKKPEEYFHHLKI